MTKHRTNLGFTLFFVVTLCINWWDCKKDFAPLGVSQYVRVLRNKGARGAHAPPYFYRSDNPISNKGGSLCPRHFQPWRHPCMYGAFCKRAS